jgi:hypothetical protein
MKSNEVQLVLYFVGPLLFLIVSYLLFRYSVALGILWIGLFVFVTTEGEQFPIVQPQQGKGQAIDICALLS